MSTVRPAVFDGRGEVEIRDLPTLLASRRLDLTPLFGEVLTLERIPEAIALLSRQLPGRDAVRVSLRIT
jgi:hypothetical protein